MFISQVGAIAVRLAENDIAFEYRNRRIFIIGSTLTDLQSIFPLSELIEHAGSIEIL